MKKPSLENSNTNRSDLAYLAKENERNEKRGEESMEEYPKREHKDEERES
jgi:hypothetical protein